MTNDDDIILPAGPEAAPEPSEDAPAAETPAEEH